MAELLARFGLTKFSLYDFDKVEGHNIVNQMFTSDEIGLPKAVTVANLIERINPDAATDIKVFPKGYTGQKLSGYVFLCVDSIELRRQIATDNRYNPNIKAMFDFRTRLTDAQHYAADWQDPASVNDFLASMDFTDAEAEAETPVSACHVALSVAPTVRMICNVGVVNFINFVKGEKLKKIILTDAFSYQIDAF